MRNDFHMPISFVMGNLFCFNWRVISNHGATKMHKGLQDGTMAKETHFGDLSLADITTRLQHTM